MSQRRDALNLGTLKKCGQNRIFSGSVTPSTSETISVEEYVTSNAKGVLLVVYYKNTSGNFHAPLGIEEAGYGDDWVIYHYGNPAGAYCSSKAIARITKDKTFMIWGGGDDGYVNIRLIGEFS